MKNKIKLSIVLSFWFVLIFMNIITVDLESSTTERRKLAQKPDLTVDTVLSTKYMNDFETYVLDQFYQRDVFRGIKANLDLNLLNKLDYHDLYIHGDSLVKIEYPLNENSLEHAASIFNSIQEKYLLDNKTYLSIIPDKHYFNEDTKYPMMDYTYLTNYFKEETSFNYIDLFDSLSLDDYYFNDPHWNQIHLEETVNILLDEMNKDSITLGEYNVALEDYKGLYQGQLGMQVSKESLTYINDSLFDEVKVKDLISDELLDVYNEAKLDGNDPYDYFLSGAMPLLEIENLNSQTDEELIIFRDSYGSSITPLLISSYRKITIVDLRYIGHQLLGDYIDFNEQTVLFLYSTTVLNNSSTLK